MSRAIKVTSLTEKERVQLLQVANGGHGCAELKRRAFSMLALAERRSETAVATDSNVNVTVPTLRRWRNAFESAPAGTRVDALMGLRGAHGKMPRLNTISSDVPFEYMDRLGKFRRDFEGGIPDLNTEVRNALELCRRRRQSRKSVKPNPAEDWLPCIRLGREELEIAAPGGGVVVDVPYALYFDSEYNVSIWADLCIRKGAYSAAEVLKKIAPERFSSSEVPLIAATCDAPHGGNGTHPPSSPVRFIAAPMVVSHHRTSLPNSRDAQARRQEAENFRREVYEVMENRLLEDIQDGAEDGAEKEYAMLKKRRIRGGWLPIPESPREILSRLRDDLPLSVKFSTDSDVAVREFKRMVVGWRPDRFEPKQVKLRLPGGELRWFNVPRPRLAFPEKRILRLYAYILSKPGTRMYRSSPKNSAPLVLECPEARLIYERGQASVVREGFPKVYVRSIDEMAEHFRAAFEHPRLQTSAKSKQDSSESERDSDRAHWFFQRWGEQSIVAGLVSFLEQLKPVRGDQSAMKARSAYGSLSSPPPPNLTNEMRNQLDGISQYIWLLPADERNAVISVIRDVLTGLKKNPPACFVYRLDGVADPTGEAIRKRSYGRYIAKCIKKLDTHVELGCVSPGGPWIENSFKFVPKVISPYFNDISHAHFKKTVSAKCPFPSMKTARAAVEKWRRRLGRHLNSKKVRRTFME